MATTNLDSDSDSDPNSDHNPDPDPDPDPDLDRRWEHDYGEGPGGSNSPDRVHKGSDTRSIDGINNVRDDWQEKQELTGFALVSPFIK